MRDSERERARERERESKCERESVRERKRVRRKWTRGGCRGSAAQMTVCIGAPIHTTDHSGILRILVIQRTLRNAIPQGLERFSTGKATVGENRAENPLYHDAWCVNRKVDIRIHQKGNTKLSCRQADQPRRLVDVVDSDQ